MLPVLLNVPRNELEWDRWGLHHRASHQLIRQAIQKQASVNLPDYYALYPILVTQPSGFLQQNASAHMDMNGVLRTQGSDLQDVNFEDERQLQAWIWLHYREHFTAESKLGVGS